MGKKKQTVGWKYYLDVLWGMCKAADELVAVKVGDRIAWTGSVTDNQTISIDKPQLMGGDKSEGGIVGDMDIMFGDDTQGVNSYLYDAIAGVGKTLPGVYGGGVVGAGDPPVPFPAFRGKVMALWKGGQIGSNNPYPKPFSFRWRRSTAGWDGAVWYPSKAVISLVVNQVKAMNPAHILYESITNTDWGKGDPRTLINDASFTAAADTLYSEGLGLCTDYSDANETIGAFQQRILNVIGGALTQSITDGLWYLDLIRDDYDFATLPIITADDVLEVQELDPSDVDGINQVQVAWHDPMTDTDRVTTPVKSLGAQRAFGKIQPVTNNYPELPTEDLANRMAQRDLNASATPLVRMRIVVNRKFYALRNGKPFRLQLPDYGIDDVVFRIGACDYGTLTDSKITFTILQDIFAMPAASYVQTQGAGWSPATTTPQVPPYHALLELPYRELAQTLSAADLAALDADAGYVGEIATRPAGVAIDYDLRTRLSGGTFAPAGRGDFCPTAQLVGAMAAEAGPTDVTLQAGSDLDLVEVGTAALVDGEIMRVDAIDASAGTATLARGCVDTAPAVHSAGAAVLFFDLYTGAPATEYLTGEVVEAVALTRTSSELLDEAAAPVDSVTLNQRQARPYAPGGLTVDGIAYPASAFGTPALAWAHRDRITQNDQLVDTTAASVGPEAGTTYTVRVYLDDVLDATYPGLSGAGVTLSALSGDGLARVEVQAIVGGLTSWQNTIAEFTYTRTEPRITESGSDRITESGQTRTVES